MVVVDTSVAFKWFTAQEENFLPAKRIRDLHLNNQENIIVPDLLLYELANAWTTKTNLSWPEIDSNLQDIKNINL